MRTGGGSLERGDMTKDAGRQEARGRIAWTVNEPLVFTMAMLTIGILLGMYIGLLAGHMATLEDGGSETEAVRGDLDALSEDVVIMAAVVEGLDARATGSALELAGTRARLESIRDDLAAVEAKLGAVSSELSRMEGSADSVSGDLNDLRTELMDVRMDLVSLQLELDDLVAQIIEGGGSGGGGGPVVPENATLLPTPHLSHYASPLMDPTCGMCHDVEPVGEVIVSGSKMYWNGSLDDAGFNTVIDRDAECIECHGSFAETGMEPSYIDISCVACHDDWADRMTARYVIESAVGDDDCLLCHGGPNAFIEEPQDYGTT